METAWELSKNWPEAELIIGSSSGHSAFEKEITHELIKATQEFSKMDKLNGNCECKKISFEITQKIKYFSHCHCSQ